jgi:hypothetical protein
MKGVARAAWRRLISLVGPYRCGACDRPLRRLGSSDLSPEAVRAHRLAGTLGGLLAAAYVCDDCTRPGGWVLIE